MKILQSGYEDSFIKIASLLGGDDYVQVARALLTNENSTDEEIAAITTMKINVVRRALYDLFGRSLIIGIRVRDIKKGWFVYRWKAQRDQVDGFINAQKRKSYDRLKKRLLHEQSHQFYSCGNTSCRRYVFDEAFDISFTCEVCNNSLKLYDSALLIKAFEWKIKKIEDYNEREAELARQSLIISRDSAEVKTKLSKAAKKKSTTKDTKKKSTTKDTKKKSAPQDTKKKSAPQDTKKKSAPQAAKKKSAPQDTKKKSAPQAAKKKSTTKDAKKKSAPQDTKKKSATKDAKKKSTAES